MMPDKQVAMIQRCRLESDQDLVISRDRPLGLPQL
jgi:hypothetical protein